ncbi:aminoglycoside phosphotransferase [Mycobacterium sp. ACS1612]|nr:aminoglycoside phosphotransferase [Mycobacterium sp. ACS1612]
MDALELAEGKRLSVLSNQAAVPMVRDGSGRWRRAHPGDGAAEALLALLSTVDESRIGDFSVRSWVRCGAVAERSVGVDQTNESVIVGDAAVVKWATHLQQGPHPAPHRISVLRDAGFDGMPAPWGVVTWRAPDGTETLVANVDEYLPDAVDGWTWAVDLLTQAAREHRPQTATDTIRQLGRLIADMHDHLSATTTTASAEDADRWRESAIHTLEIVCALDDSACVELTRSRRDDIASAFEGLGEFAGTPVIEGHGDLHVGQVLRSGERLLVTDFDGNPVLPASQRALPIPAALDVAGMTQSLAHAAIVAARYTELDPAALAAVDAVVRETFLGAYASTLHHPELYDPELLRPFRLQQVLREIVYAARHLPRWMYVPDAALPALLGDAI